MVWYSLELQQAVTDTARTELNRILAIVYSDEQLILLNSIPVDQVQD